MRKFSFPFICLLCLTIRTVMAIDAPITTAGVVTNAITGIGGVVVPISVKNFINIGKFSLTLKFDTAVIKYVSAALHPSFSGMSVVYSVQCTHGKLVITYPQGTGVTLPDLTHLVDLTFTYVSGTAQVVWGYSGRVGWCSGICTCNCQYYQYVGSNLVLCDDTPRSSHYIDGGVSNRTAPVTFAPVVGNAVNGNYNLPITVNNFTNISGISLEMRYDANILSYIGATPNAAFGSNFNVGANDDSLNIKKISMGWNNLLGPVTLTDGSTLVTLNFDYSNANGGYSTLTWLANGQSCQYADGTYQQVLIDFPSSGYYKNGILFSSGHFAPQTWLPSISNAGQGTIPIPVNVNYFKDVKSFTLSFLYDPTVITYNTSFTQNSSLTGSFIVNDVADANGKRKLVMTWTGTGSVTLPNGSTLATLNYTYISGASALTWVTASSSCRFNDAAGNAYYDLPKATYYQDGVVTNHTAPLTAAWYASGTIGQSVTVPVKVYHYSNIGYFNLTMDYDPNVLVYQSVAPNPSLGGTFSAMTQGLGRLLLNWSGTAAGLPDSSILMDLTFIYNGGSTPLAWYTSGTACEYTEGGIAALYDQPKSGYYINGNIGPNPVIANFSVSNATPAPHDTVTFTDLSTGSPDGWKWTISPLNFIFVNGTNSSSKNPQVSFSDTGTFTVTLVASNGIKSNIRFKTVHVQSGIPGLWTGITSSDWNTGSNWNNSLIPGSSVNVTIPASAPNWPQFTGDLVMGTHCKNITLNGSSFLTVTGNFTINGGSTLSFAGTATLKVGASWSDSGTFITGTGTVEFYGSTPASILAPSTETFYNLIENKTSTTLTIPYHVVVNGVLTVW
jgi:hypothetical protein